MWIASIAQPTRNARWGSIANKRDAEAALEAAEAGDEALRDEIVPGIRDPFKNTPTA